MLRLTGYFCLMFTLTASVLTAQPVCLSLDECLRIALENNYQIKVARTDRDIVENEKSISQYLPTVDLNARQNETFSDIENSRNDSYSAGVSLNWRLFDGLAMFVRDDRQKAQLAVADKQLKQTIDLLITEICAEYYNILMQQKRLEAAHYTLTLSEERHQQAREMYGIGTLSGLELRQAKIDLNADSSTLVRQEETVRNAYVRLNTLMNVPLSGQDFVRDTIVLAPKMDFETLRQGTVERNNTLIIARQAQKISEYDVKLARAYLMPTLDFGAGYNYSASNTPQQNITFNRSRGPNWGFTLSWNLFAGFDDAKRLKSAQLGVKGREYSYQQAETEILGNLTLLYNTYENNILLIEFERESAEVASASVGIALERYKIGMLSGLEFRDYQKNYLDAIDRKWNAMYLAKISEINLRMLSGEL